MALQPIQQVFRSLEAQQSLRSPQSWQQLLQAWQEVVGTTIAAQSCPVSLQHDVLWVATANAAWSQNLMFERRRLLEKLNQRLNLGLTDLRFSPAHWQKTQTSEVAPSMVYQATLWRNHPSRLTAEFPAESPSQITATAFDRWATRMRSRGQTLPICPQCHCPTPLGELARWQVCGVCQTNSQPPNLLNQTMS